MPVVAAAAVTAAAVTYGATRTSGATREATRAQERSSTEASNATERATNAAIALEREKEAERRREHELAVGQYQQQWEAWNAARTGMMSRYGINPPPMAAGSRAQGQGVGAKPTLGTFAGNVGAFAGRPVGYARMTPTTPINAPALVPPSEPPPMNLGNLGDWNEWRNYRPRTT